MITHFLDLSAHGPLLSGAYLGPICKITHSVQHLLYVYSKQWHSHLFISHLAARECQQEGMKG